MPIPITIAPSIWFRPATGLRIRPPSFTLTSRLTDGRDHRSGRHRTALKRACRKRRIAERYFNLVERHTGLLRGELREDRVSAGADVLGGAGDAGGAIVAELDVGLGGEACGDP